MTKDKALVQKISYLKDVLNYLFDSKKRVAQIIQTHLLGNLYQWVHQINPKNIISSAIVRNENN